MEEIEQALHPTNNSSDLLKLSRTELLTGEHPLQSTLSSIVQAAYDNPVKTGLGVAAVAAAGALIYATKGAAAERLLGSKADVLIIEDTPAMAYALKDAVVAQGHNATWVTSIKSLQPLVGMTADGAEMSLSKRIKLALVDGDLGKGNLTGQQIVGTLKQRNILSIGTSSVETFNAAMRENGAAITGNKAVVFAGLLGGKLNLKAALKAPALAQEQLTAFGAVMRNPEFATLRKEADEKLVAYLMKK